MRSSDATRGASAAGPVLVLATHNLGKLAELRDLLRAHAPRIDVDTQVVDAGAVGAPDVAETGITFEANALLKARAVAAETGMTAVADDSGLAVDVLGGAPGIFSARWAGRHGDDAANMALLLAQLADIAAPNRRARFVCAAAMVGPDGSETVKTGALTGSLLLEPRGEGGFGYDPILVPDGMDRSCAELTADEKNAISHRGQAFRALVPELVAAIA